MLIILLNKLKIMKIGIIQMRKEDKKEERINNNNQV